MEGFSALSIESKVFKGASWLALFKLISQVFSWIITIVVARILVPDDYGLMEMATIITGYAFFFSELGLGAAIIQKPAITKGELSSVFWFGLGVSVMLSNSHNL
jgi:O-antigen/teichoic acid export membrane protein